MADTGHSRVTVVRGGTVWTGGLSARVLLRTDLVIEDGVVVALEPEDASFAAWS
jgi:hypothetical protein